MVPVIIKNNSQGDYSPHTIKFQCFTDSVTVLPMWHYSRHAYVIVSTSRTL